jgi:hypothetical protein
MPTSWNASNRSLRPSVLIVSFARVSLAFECKSGTLYLWGNVASMYWFIFSFTLVLNSVRFGNLLSSLGDLVTLLLLLLLSSSSSSSLLFYYHQCDSVVSIATGYGLDERGVGVRIPVGSKIFSNSSRPVLGSTQQVREAGHSHPTSAEVKKIWIYISTSPYAFMV